jgi:Cys-rich repeat protein
MPRSPVAAVRLHHLLLPFTIACALVAGCAQPGNVVGPGDMHGSRCTDGSCGCARDADCAHGLRCDTTSGRCVPCLDDRDCPAGERCDPRSGSCTPGCAADHGCGDGGVCELDAGVCVACLGDPDCHDPMRPRCDLHTSRCEPCLPAPQSRPGDCPVGNYCDGAGGDGGADYACVPGCAVDSDCPTPDGGSDADGGYRGTYCEAARHQCVVGCDIPGSCGACGNLCQAGWSCCNNTCSNPIVDVANCGGCGIVCALPHATPTCVARACAVGSCDPAWADCNGRAQDGCEVEIDNNINDCGQCGHGCSVMHATPNCVNGQCGIDTCISPWADCNGRVTDGCETQVGGSDVTNCGACGLHCSNNNIVTLSCTAGVCDGACVAGTADCNHDKATDGCEVQTQVDPANCGSCGAACSPNHVSSPSCAGGVCNGACDPGYSDCNMNLASDGCEVNTLTDKANCGGCGAACSMNNMATVACTNGACTGTCNTGFADCNMNLASDGCEVNTFTESANCGGCGKVCSSTHIAVPTCLGGACNGACDAGWADCNNDKLRDGCETSVVSDVANCGLCGGACSANNIAMVSCANGVCNGACNAGYADCDLNKLFNGCEVNTNMDPANCGGCGLACSTANMATVSCGAGVCNGTCNAGYADCDMNLLTNGCEVNTTSDRNHCGGCGNACSTNNMATVSCANSVCNGTCNNGYADCDMNLLGNGCEVDTLTDKANCGGCGKVCSGNHITSPICTGGLCTGACDTGYGDCNGDKLSDGCETALNTVQNCGACGNACGAGSMCVGGACTTCSVKVNEVMTGTTASGSEEFVEIYNPCTTSIDMTGWHFDYRPASNLTETVYYTFTGPLAVGAYFVIGGANFTGTPDYRLTAGFGFSSTGGAVGIRDNNGVLIDSVAYQTLTAINTFTEGSPAPNPPVVASPGNSISRLPNGVDTNDNSVDFKVSTMATPGAANQ